MTHRGKSGKLQKQKRVSHAFLRAWKSGEKQKRRIPTFPQRRRRRAGSESEGRRKNTKPDRSLAKKSGHLDVLRTGFEPQWNAAGESSIGKSNPALSHCDIMVHLSKLSSLPSIQGGERR